MCDLDPFPFDFESLAFDFDPAELAPNFDPAALVFDFAELGTWPVGDPPAAPGRAVRRCPTCGQPWPAADPSKRRRPGCDIFQNHRRMWPFPKRNRLGA